MCSEDVNLGRGVKSESLCPISEHPQGRSGHLVFDRKYIFRLRVGNRLTDRVIVGGKDGVPGRVQDQSVSVATRGSAAIAFEPEEREFDDPGRQPFTA